MPAVAKEKKKSQSSVGAPSQLKQSSRKGKKAWRKNVDIEDVEQGLEGIRAEERTYGTALQKQSNDELFRIDIQGDNQVRKHLPKFDMSRLTSAKILAQRSAIPVVYSRPTKQARSTVSREDKDKLLRMAKRPRKGPLNSIIDPTEIGAGSALIGVSEAVHQSGNYDPWAEVPEQEEVKHGLETVQPKAVKPPQTRHPRKNIEVPAVIAPHQGTSYNPPEAAHQALLSEAHAAEEKRVRDAEKLAEVKNKMQQALEETGRDDNGALGMIITEPGEEEEEDVPVDVPIPRKPPPRKTKQQRVKAKKLLAEKRALAEMAARKRMLSTITSAKFLRKQSEKLTQQREQAHAQRLLLLQQNQKKSLVGHKLGKHKVPEGEVEVQLGEDLSESLRALKVEGNLFKDRFLSLQQRALVEPRTLVLPKKRKHRIVEYEKHAWKNFDM